MKLEHFRYLVEIGRQHSISSAARTLFMGQTTLSAVVKSAENELGFEIFQRTPRGVYPTPEGRDFLVYAEEIMLKYDEILRLRERRQSAFYPATVLVSTTFSIALPVSLNKRVLQLAPESSLIFDTYPRLQVFSKLTQNEANIGIIHLRKDEFASLSVAAQKSNLTVEVLRADHFYLCVSAKSELAAMKSVNPGNMPPVNVASVKNFYKVGEVESLFSASPERKLSYTVFPNIEAACRAVKDQNMAAMFTGYLVSTQIDPREISAIPVDKMDNMSEIDICMVHRDEKSLTYLEKLLVDNIRDYFADLQLPDFTI